MYTHTHAHTHTKVSLYCVLQLLNSYDIGMALTTAELDLMQIQIRQLL